MKAMEMENIEVFEDEVIGLVDKERIEQIGTISKSQKESKIIIVVASFVLMATLIFVLSLTQKKTSSELFSCPLSVAIPLNDIEMEWYEGEDTYIHKKWDKDAVDELKSRVIDGWSRNYNILKKTKGKFVIDHFSELKPGDKIFESACGVGLNLFMKAELLKERKGIHGLEFYGIEYRQVAADQAFDFLSQMLPSLGSKLGSICKADATDLSFIPDEYFDLAYTGYIDPLEDPLKIEEKSNKKIESHKLCKEKTWDLKLLSDLDQREQERWYTAWVIELIRITKKGKPVIIEEISLPLCEDTNDWGGKSS
jgi:hypothetical protein